jgi:hypothetical protein
MKKKLFLAAVPALVLAGGFLFFACSTVSPVTHGTYTSRAGDSTVFTIEPDNNWSIEGRIEGKGTYEFSEDGMAVTLFAEAPVTDDNGYHVIEVKGNEGYTKMEPVEIGTAIFSSEKEFKVVKVVAVTFSNGKAFSGSFASRD